MVALEGPAVRGAGAGTVPGEGARILRSVPSRFPRGGETGQPKGRARRLKPGGGAPVRIGAGRVPRPGGRRPGGAAGSPHDMSALEKMRGIGHGPLFGSPAFLRGRIRDKLQRMAGGFPAR